MKVEVRMPKMGESITEGTLIKWHKNKGDKVEKDEIIFEISTDKVDTEIPSPESGVLQDIKVFENDTVEVDSLVAVIETNGQTETEEPPAEEKVLEEESEPSTTQVGGEFIDITMPKMGESVMEGTIIKWHKNVGEKIERDEILFEISTDKVDTEVPSPVEGTLAEVLFKENDTVEVGTSIARVSTSGGIVKKTTEEESAAGETKQVDEETNAESPKPAASGGGNRFYSPLVMNIAKKENVSFDELESIRGTGIDGRVSKKDILKYLEDRTSGVSKPEPQQSQSELKHASTSSVKMEAPKFEEGDGIKIEPMDNIRQRIMYHMENSRDTSVHVTAVNEVDMTAIHEFIKANKSRLLKEDGVKLTYMPFIAYAAIKALKEYPYLNASIDDKNIVLKKFINLGIAVAVEPNGLIVPNIKSADEKSVVGLAKSIAQLSNKSRNKGLLPDDIMDGTFTITNYGVFGSLFGTPIINQPEVGILGVGAVTKKPVVVENNGMDAIVIKPMLYLSLSHDHRLVDGMLGGMFLKSIKDTLENFDTSVV